MARRSQGRGQGEMSFVNLMHKLISLSKVNSITPKPHPWLCHPWGKKYQINNSYGKTVYYSTLLLVIFIQENNFYLFLKMWLFLNFKCDHL